MDDCVAHLNAALNAKKFDSFSEFLTPDFVHHITVSETQSGVGAFIDMFQALVDAMPDLHAQITATVAQGDRVAIHTHYTGTHLGNYLNVAPATGTTVSWTGMAIYRLDQSGRIAERWQDIDMMGLMTQLGAGPGTAVSAKDIVRRVYEDLWGKGELALTEDLISEHFVDHGAHASTPQGRDAFRQMVSQYRQAFPDLVVVVDQVLDDGSRTALRYTAHGTHQGTFLGIAPSQRAVSFTGMAFVRVSHGKLAERWQITDMGGLMAQLPQAPVDPVEKNKDLVVRYFEAIWNSGQFEREPEFVAKDIVVHQPPIPGLPDGIAGPLQIVGMFRAAIPDIRVRHTVLFGENDKVVHRWEARGHHTTAPLFGAPISNKEIVMTGINSFRIANGLIVERWGHMDVFGLLQQLGLIPTN